MFFALDQNRNRVNAEDGVFTNCICPACECPVIQRKGEINRHHFAHDPKARKDALCPYDLNKDYINMSEWHIRMQEYFPKEQREKIFTDRKTGEKHIADVYIEEKNTVLEFQYSSISQNEFLKRTNFYLTEGYRVAWLFYEDWKNKDGASSQYYKNGKLVQKKYRYKLGQYSEKCYQ